MSAEILPAVLLKRKAVVYVRQSRKRRYKRIWRVSAGSTIWLKWRGAMASSTLK
jgi:hypothetical protein